MARPSNLRVMGILLWHHLQYYKRHRVQLILNLFLPIVLGVGIRWLVSTVEPDQIEAVSPNTRKPQWLLPYAADDMLKESKRLRFRPREESFNNTDKFERCQGIFGASNQDPYIKPKTEHDRKLMKCMALMSNIQRLSNMRPSFSFFGITLPPAPLKYPLSFSSPNELGLMLMGSILYYPNTSAVEDVVTIMRSKLQPFFEIPGVFASKSGGFINESEVQECFGHPKKRIMGFRTKSEAKDYISTHLAPSERVKPFCFRARIEVPMVWGVVEFNELSSDEAVFTVHHDSRVRNVLKDRALHLQSVVETAIIQNRGDPSSAAVDLVIDTLPLPEKCWERPNKYITALLNIVLSLVVVMGFVVFSLNCIELMVNEKCLRLREFMAIMGVSTPFLKLSWALFYTVYLVLASAITTAVLFWAIGPLLADGTSPLVIYVLLLTFNLSRLAYSFFIASILKKPKSISTIVTSLDIIFWMLSIFVFGEVRFLNGSRLIMARIASLHYVVPLSLGCFYISSWARKFIPLNFSHLYMSPEISDLYGGLGVCLLSLIGDACLYVLMSWYIEKVFPGEFGQKHSYLFFLQKSYWFPESTDSSKVKPTDGGLKNSPLFENNTGILVRSLSKTYPNGFTALKSFTEHFKPHQITAFLGKNGAGKSTSMNMMVGLLDPSSGEVKFGDLDLKEDLPKIREKLGFVPQYDILYPDLSLYEHAKFYGWLRGLTTQEVNAELDRQLVKMGLVAAQNTTATKLSGGQKRKLSLMIAYFGSPEYVILDEPTSGVDPFSARNIWDLILDNRRTATTILSTHQMDEADLLADWITMIESGELKCSGTPLTLKEEYGEGFRIVISTGKADMNEIGSIRQLMLDKMQLKQNEVFMEGKDIICKIPTDKVGTKALVGALQSLEQTIEKVNKKMSYGVTEPSLEEVFFSATSGSANNFPKANKSASEIKYEKVSWIEGLVQQFVSQVGKRFWHTVSSWNMLAYQIVLPLTFICLMLLIGDNISNAYSGVDYTVESRIPYYENVWFMKADENDFVRSMVTSMESHGLGPLSGDEHEPEKVGDILDPVSSNFDQRYSNCSCKTYCPKSVRSGAKNTSHFQLPNDGVVYGANGVEDLHDWIIKLDHIPKKVIGGFQFSGSASSPKLLMYADKEHVPHVVNAIHNVLLRVATGKPAMDITYRFDSQLLTELDGTREFFGNIISDLLQITFLVFSLLYATKAITVFIMNEKESGFKKLQFLAKANRAVYWVTNFIWDFLCYLFTIFLVCTLLYAVQNPFSDFVRYLLPVVIPYGLLMVSFVYFLSMFFKKTGTVTTLIEVMGFVFFFISSGVAIFANYSHMMCIPTACKIPAVIFDVGENFTRDCPRDCDEALSNYNFTVTINPIMRMIPLHFLVEGLMTVGLMTFAVRTGQQLMLQVEGTQVSLNKTISLMYGSTDLLSMEFFGQYIVFGLFIAILYVVIVIVLEYVLPNGIRLSCGKSGEAEGSANQNIDEDVYAEQKRASMLNEESKVPLVVQNIKKSFKSMKVPAVNNVSFAITHPETFGLLGVNGAGKSTTFKILSGYDYPDLGRCLVQGDDIRRKAFKAEQSMMYCPQDNILAEGISVRRHLMAFAGFLRIPNDTRKELVETLIDEVGLTQYTNRHVDKLSGGNKRKVQLAIAIMGYPSLVFLDEPTTGMDPTARRMTWDAINRAVAKGSSVILTSHRMEECEVLCHRLVIMVAGNFRCIGSVQYLKDKLGNRYNFKMRLEKPSEEDTRGIKSFVHQNFGDSAFLVEEHATILHYEIEAARLKRLSSLFSLMIDCQEKFNVRNFTISQVTLDQVFVNMAKEKAPVDIKYRKNDG